MKEEIKSNVMPEDFFINLKLTRAEVQLLKELCYKIQKEPRSKFTDPCAILILRLQAILNP